MRNKAVIFFAAGILLCLYTPERLISSANAANAPAGISGQFIGSWSLVSFTDKNGRLMWRNQVTIQRPVKFTIKDHGVLIRDSKGKQYELDKRTGKLRRITVGPRE